MFASLPLTTSGANVQEEFLFGLELPRSSPEPPGVHARGTAFGEFAVSIQAPTGTVTARVRASSLQGPSTRSCSPRVLGSALIQWTSRALKRPPSFSSLIALCGIMLLDVCPAYAQGTLFGYDLSANLILQTNESLGLPEIVGQPQAQVVVPGELASFFVVVADSSGLTYQWRFNNTIIAGATNDTLLLTNVSTNNEGQYSVVLVNGSGSVTSALAALMIDSRGCGMPDSWQLAYFGNLTNSATGNFDGDGVCNLDEFLEGTDPTDPTSYHPRLHIVSTGSGVGFASPPLPYYTLGQVVTLIAMPDQWSSFLGWSGAASGIKTQISLVMNGHKTVTASFGEQMPPPVFQSVVPSNNAVNLTWSAFPGRSYQVQFKTNLSQTVWNNLGGGVTATDFTATTNDVTGPDAQRFYRVGILP